MRLDATAGLHQRERLESEGVRFGPRGRVSLAAYGLRTRSRGSASSERPTARPHRRTPGRTIRNTNSRRRPPRPET
jgi:hypothetical protein